MCCRWDGPKRNLGGNYARSRGGCGRIEKRKRKEGSTEVLVYGLVDASASKVSTWRSRELFDMLLHLEGDLPFSQVTTLTAFGEIVVGSPGSGKSTYCYGKHQLFSAINRPISIVNLDPANDNIPYPCAVDICSLVTLQEVMAEHGLRPNGGMLYCMEYLEANYDWPKDKLKSWVGTLRCSSICRGRSS